MRLSTRSFCLKVFLLLTISSCDKLIQTEVKIDDLTPSQIEGSINLEVGGISVATSQDFKASPSVDLLYNGISMTQFLNEPIQNYINVFGKPTYDNYWFLMYGDWDNEYIAVVFDPFFYPNDIRSIANIPPSMAKINDVSLDKTRTELIAIFGEPYKEYFDEGHGDTFTPSYNIRFEQKDYIFTVTSKSHDGIPYGVSITPKRNSFSLYNPIVVNSILVGGYDGENWIDSDQAFNLIADKEKYYVYQKDNDQQDYELYTQIGTKIAASQSGYSIGNRVITDYHIELDTLDFGNKFVLAVFSDWPRNPANNATQLSHLHRYLDCIYP